MTPAERTRYRTFREGFIAWLDTVGKDPDRDAGYAPKTVQNTAYRTSKFMRFVWEVEGAFTLNVRHEHADAYLDRLAHDDVSDAHGDAERKALLRLFRWLEVERGYPPWQPGRTFASTPSVNPPDYLTLAERGQIREAAQAFEPIPAYNDLSPAGRDRWRSYLASVLDRPVERIRPADWDGITSWKVTSLVWTSLDAGLRPHEVEHASVGWVDVGNRLLRIPAAESAKVAEHWHVALTEGTADALAAWLDERAASPMYDGREDVWLTREGNPYTAQSLRRLLHRLCAEADIPTADRRMSWYAIRHSVGTYMVRERGLAAAQAQLRHKRPETTMKYDAVPLEDRRAALERMG